MSGHPATRTIRREHSANSGERRKKSRTHGSPVVSAKPVSRSHDGAVAVQFDEPADLTDEDVLDLGRASPAGTRTVRWLLAGLILVAGFAVGRMSVHPHYAVAVRADHTTQAVDRQGCPSGHACTTHEVSAPDLIGLLHVEFPDARGPRVVATDDSTSGRRYRLEVVATLLRGVRVQVVAEDQTAQPSRSTPWSLVAVGTSARPDHAQRTIIDSRTSGLARIRLAVDPGGQRPGRSDFRCDWCVHTSDAAALRRLLSQPQPPLAVIAGIALHDTARSQALAWLG